MHRENDEALRQACEAKNATRCISPLAVVAVVLLDNIVDRLTIRDGHLIVYTRTATFTAGFWGRRALRLMAASRSFPCLAFG